MDCRPPGSSVPGFSQGGILEWLAISLLQGTEPASPALAGEFFTTLPGASGGSDGKESAFRTRDPGLSPGSGRSLREGNGYPLQYSLLENSIEERDGAHGVAKESNTTERLILTLSPGKPKRLLAYFQFEAITYTGNEYSSVFVVS